MKRIALAMIASLCVPMTPLAPSAAADPVEVRIGKDGSVITKVKAWERRTGKTGTVRKAPANGQPAVQRPRCTYRPLTEAEVAALWQSGIAGERGEDGYPMYRECPPGADGTSGPVWVSTSDKQPRSAIPTVSPRDLALQAAAEMQLPFPQVETAPPSDSPLLVNTDTWWWIPNVTGPKSHRVSAGPVWAETTATPVRSRWRSSSGQVTTCNHMGVPWNSAQGSSGQGGNPCAHKYMTAHEADAATIEVVWQITWRGAGGSSGSLPETITSSDHTVQVFERQAVVVR